MKTIDKMAHYARTMKQIEVIEFRKLMAKDKINAETITIHLLSRLLDKST